MFQMQSLVTIQFGSQSREVIVSEVENVHLLSYDGGVYWHLVSIHRQSYAQMIYNA